MYNFKDFLTVDYAPGRDDQIKNAAKKRKRGSTDTSGVVESQSQIDEVLSPAQRMRKKAQLRRQKAKIAMGQRRAKKRIATGSTIKKRAMRRARMAVLKKILRGRSKSDLSYGARGSYEKILNKRKAMIQRLARKLLVKVRQDDRSKFKNKSKK